ncbi:voltage-dependent T-type calcium channel subunit alpha-1G isoform X4 [Salarias fasciatus]|uniref:voltage-dependent T-type calcium channel subunit alpha-1G isoform X4 n=1 Tax=Salarias fasciatus TaxID=181472 RepID=UPI00117675FE|nr:voltage-dependent T-type calcium channel subunit alpha-1G isoform X4 [Salarias fasciatus]
MMAEDGGNLSGVPDARDSEGRSSLPRTFIRLNDLSGLGSGGGGGCGGVLGGPSSSSSSSGGAERGEVVAAVLEPASPAPDGISTGGEDASASGGESLPYPTLAPVVFFYLKQTTRPRSWCLKMVCNPWFERASMLVILLNCVTLGMFHPCEDIKCDSDRCKILQDFDDFIFAFFAIEMVIKMVALGIFGKKCYLGDTWNRLDFFIVLAGMLEYSLNLQNVSFSAVRTVRVLRPLRAINRVPSMRILVTLLLDTLPMLGNVLLLCFFVFFIFGIVGVQLWAGLLRNRCFVEDNFSFPLSVELGKYYHTENNDENPFICSQPRENGMRDCGSIPKLYEEGVLQCNLDMYSYNSTDNTTCVNWNQYYTNCSAGPLNPFKGAINFDNICFAWIAIFQVITLEGWVDIMYFVMDAHSFYNFIYFILLIIIGSFFMINLCLVVIATQFSETKQRESQLMKEQRVRFMSNASTLASLSEPGSCYDELLKYLVHIIRKGARQVAHVCRFLARRAGLNIAASPPASDPQRSQSQRRRRKTSRQGSVSVHHMVHHHHHHHHHYHLGNGSVRGAGSIRCLEGRDVEVGALNNNGGTLVATTASGHLALAPSSSIAVATSDANLAALASPAAAAADSSSVRSVFNTEILRCTPSPTNPGSYSLAPAAASRVMKRNSVPFAAPGPKNYPTLQARALAESRRGSVATSTLTSMNLNLNIPPVPLERRLSSVVDTHNTAQLSRQLSARELSTTSSAMDTATLTLDPENCPYCAKALANESEGGTDGNETPGDSDSEGVYEFTQDLHHRDRRDSRQPRRKYRRLGKTAAKVVHFWRLVCDTFRKIVDSKYFGRGIMIAILINTMSMGIEYHEQPEELTNALEISNIVFTSLFSLEMLLKVLVYGPFGYIKNPYNIFDGIIVVISVWEIVGQQGGGLSVLRTFRLMRVLKLVRFMPALQRQLVVLMKTMDNVATFCMLLMLFIFIFSILGMHLFGCKFGSERDGDTLPDRKNFDSLLWAIVTVFQILTQEDWNKVLYNGMASTTPVAALYFIALMTFGNYVLFNLLVAILVEGFQTEEVSKREELHAQLSLIQLPVESGGDASKSGSEIDSFARSMEDVNGSKKDLSASAVVPVNGHVDLKTSLTPPLITHTAATPMPVPKLPVAGDPILGYESRRGSSVSIDPACYDKSPTSARSSSPYAPWSSGSGRTSRRSSWNSLGRVPSHKRQKRQSGERRSLLSGDGGSSSEEGEGGGEEGGGLMEEDDASLARTDSMSQSQGGPRHRRMESVETRSSMDLPPDALLQVPYLYRSASMHSSRPPSLGHLRPPEHSDCNGKGSPSALGPTHVSLEDNTEDENVEEEVNLGRVARLFRWLEKKQPEWCRQRDTWSLYLFPPESRFRIGCNKIITHKMFDHVVLVIIFLNCITIAMERPRIDPSSAERIFLTLSNYIFTAIFVAEMTVKIVALGWCFGDKAYLRSSWNILDGMLVMISVIDILVSLISNSGTKILGMLRVLRLLRTLRPLRVISRAPGLKLVVETLMSSLKPIGNIVVICCAFFIIFGILGVQLFKGKFFICQGEDVRNITNKSDCLLASYRWVRHKYNFDNLGQALMSLFVLASKDGWVDIMYDGLDAVGVDQQPIMNYNPWMLLYFISFLLIVAFFVLNMFVGVVVENFHKCRRHQEAEEAKRREEKRLKRMEKKRRNLLVPGVSWALSDGTLKEAQSKPYYSDYSPTRLLIHKMCTSHYLDLFITIVIGLNVITMSMEHYQQPKELDEALKICNYIFTLIFVLESVFKLVAFGFRRFFKDKWNQLDLAIVLLSIMGITLEEIEVNASLPINPTIIRIMRVLRIARVLKLLKMAVGMRALLDTVMQALPQVGNLGLLFMLLFFIFAALGVELFGDLICDELHPCEGLGRYATFRNFGMAFLLLFRVSTGDNWNGIMKDTLRDCAHDTSTCYNTVVSPIYFVSFVLTAQFVLVNVVIAVLMKHLEESNKEAKEEAELEAELELELQMDVGDMAARSPQLNPLALGMDRSSSGGSPWRSTGGGDMEQERGGPMDSPTADITRDSVSIRAEPPSYLEPQLEFVQRRAQFDSVSLVIQGSMEGELSLMDNLSGSICHYYALPPKPSKHSSDKKIPLAEMEALSLASEKSWSLALTDDSAPDDFNPLFLSSLECNTDQFDPEEPPEVNLLSVRKPAVGRTHSLPNDSYMFLPPQPLSPMCPAPAPLLAQSQGPQRSLGTNRAPSGSSTSVRSQPEEFSQQLTVPTDLFRPISPHSHSDSESIPRQPPPRRTHTFSRTLRRQAAVSTDSQEALCSDGAESSEGLVNVASLGLPPSPTSSSSSSASPSPSCSQHHHPHHLHLHRHQQPALCLVPATPGASPKPSPRPGSVHTQQHDRHCLISPSEPPPLLPARSHQQEEACEDREVSLITRAGLVGSDDIATEDSSSSSGNGGYGSYAGCPESRSPCLRQLKRFHSAETQGRSALLPRPRPHSWLDDPRRHSVEVCPSTDSSPQRSTASTSSGFVSRADSLQIPGQVPAQTSLPSPRRKKKMSPPCISVDPPDGTEPQSGLYPSLGLAGLGMPPPLPSRDTCLRRRAPSSDSKDSFDLGVGDGSGQEGGSPNPGANPKLLTLPSFSFEKTSSEH